jgi:hypothetical protein
VDAPGFLTHWYLTGTVGMVDTALARPQPCAPGREMTLTPPAYLPAGPRYAPSAAGRSSHSARPGLEALGV